ncbi:MAG TPA: hypothetical protein VMV69_23165, partial [Pirellulales bacterium]|nr:hypothetical protein [Pirellulales bacterium]
ESVHVIPIETTSRQRQLGHETPFLRMERRIPRRNPHWNNDLVSAGPVGRPPFHSIMVNDGGIVAGCWDSFSTFASNKELATSNSSFTGPGERGDHRRHHAPRDEAASRGA